MAETAVAAMTTSEWELMRIIWTEGEASSAEVIALMQEKRDWSQSTIKTLLGRLVKKEMLQTEKKGRHFIYHPTVPETEAMNQTVSELFTHLCSMKKGAVITNLLTNVALTKTDIAQMQQVLTDKLETAPETIACDCVPGEKHC
ncbi:CopY/TcrY family copper transport repressor [Pediococcus siamensis]|uniref:CopY/TcrY family copper transport repressor n=1 Tax=Pediococcus siamensis TaxID=381829 RepID=UPI00399F2E70